MVKMTKSKPFQAYLPNSPDIQPHPLQSPAGQPRRADLQVLPGEPGPGLPLQLRGDMGCGPVEERVLLTRLHAVADIHRKNCGTTLGWKYEHAFESSRKCKEGKSIIELAHMIKDKGWE